MMCGKALFLVQIHTPTAARCFRSAPCPTIPWWGRPPGPVPAPTAVSRHLEQPEKRGNNRWSREGGRQGDWVGGEWVSPFSCFSNNTYSGKPDASRTLSLRSVVFGSSPLTVYLVLLGYRFHFVYRLLCIFNRSHICNLSDHSKSK